MASLENGRSDTDKMHGFRSRQNRFCYDGFGGKSSKKRPFLFRGSYSHADPYAYDGYNYLQTGEYSPKASVSTIANAMDVGAPSNFARIMHLYDNSHQEVCKEISGATYSDSDIAQGVRECLQENGYLLDPHGACGYLALKELLQEDETGIFLETAHPAKFKETMEGITGKEIDIPQALQEFMKGEKKSVQIDNCFETLKSYLLNEGQSENDKYYN